MKKYKVTGMSCAACSAMVERAVCGVTGAEDVSVNLLTGDLSVGGTAADADIRAAVIAAGYGIEDAEKAQTGSGDKAFKAIKRRFIISLALLLVIMYFSMFASMFGAPLPAVLADNPAYTGCIELILTLAVCIINRKFFINGFNERIFVRFSHFFTCIISIKSFCSFCFSSR